jgi:hypothetical protein
MSDCDRGAWRSDGVVALRCAVLLSAVEVAGRVSGFRLRWRCWLLLLALVKPNNIF